MEKAAIIFQIIVSILLMIFILVQNKDGGLSAVFGGGESFQAVKRGPEKIIHYTTIVLGFLFMANALLIALI
jgi:protein translocase SecG subunit